MGHTQRRFYGLGFTCLWNACSTQDKRRGPEAGEQQEKVLCIIVQSMLTEQSTASGPKFT